MPPRLSDFSPSMWHGRLAREVLYSAPIDGTPSIQAIAQAIFSVPQKNASLLLVSVEYDRRLRSTTSHGQDARATCGVPQATDEPSVPHWITAPHGPKR